MVSEDALWGSQHVRHERLRNGIRLMKDKDAIREAAGGVSGLFLPAGARRRIARGGYFGTAFSFRAQAFRGILQRGDTVTSAED